MKKWIGILALCVAVLACTFDESQLRPAKDAMSAPDSGADLASLADARPVAVDMARVADALPVVDARSAMVPDAALVVDRVSAPDAGMVAPDAPPLVDFAEIVDVRSVLDLVPVVDTRPASPDGISADAAPMLSPDARPNIDTVLSNCGLGVGAYTVTEQCGFSAAGWYCNAANRNGQAVGPCRAPNPYGIGTLIVPACSFCGADAP